MGSITSAQASRAADAVAAQCNSGSLRIYSGTPPANAAAALSGNTLLAECAFSTTAFLPAVNGVAVARTISSDTNADATGVATFFRALETGGTNVVFQGTVSTAGAELNLTSISVVAGGTVAITSFSYAQALS